MAGTSTLSTSPISRYPSLPLGGRLPFSPRTSAFPLASATFDLDILAARVSQSAPRISAVSPLQATQFRPLAASAAPLETAAFTIGIASAPIRSFSDRSLPHTSVIARSRFQRGALQARAGSGIPFCTSLIDVVVTPVARPPASPEIPFTSPTEDADAVTPVARQPAPASPPGAPLKRRRHACESRRSPPPPQPQFLVTPPRPERFVCSSTAQRRLLWTAHPPIASKRPRE